MHDAERSGDLGGATPIDEGERTSRQRALLWVGERGQRRLRESRVLLVGAGGLAAPIVQYLAGAGVGRLEFIDFDVIEPSNLARQVLFTAADVGRPKVEVLAEVAARLAPSSRVEGHQVRLTDDMTRHLFGDLAPDVVIDTTDDWATRLLVADACRDLRIPLVWPTAIGTDGQLTVFSGADGDPGIDDLVDRTTAPNYPVSCAEQGVLGSLCGQVGAMAATETIKLLIGAGRPLVGRVAIIDGLGATVREVPLVVRRRVTGTGDALSSASTSPATGASSSAAPAAEARVSAAAAGAPATTPFEMGHEHEHAQRRSRGHLVTIPELVAAPLGTVLIDVREASMPALPWPPRELELLELVREPLESLASAIDAGELPTSIERASRVVVACAFGPRARHAAAMLRAAGVSGVAVLDEGTAGLRRAVDVQHKEESAHA